jgi:kynurenine formamidase
MQDMVSRRTDEVVAVTASTVARTHEERAGRESGLEFYDLSHPWGSNAPLWPYFPDVKIERFHYMAKSGVLSQQITTFMHCTTHTDAPAHVVEGARFMDEVPLSSYFGSGVVVSIPKDKWEVVTADDLEQARPEIRPGDIVIVNTGWHRYYGDNRRYFVESPGTYKEAGEWLRDRGVKGFGIDCQALDHPLGTAIGPQPNGPLIPGVLEDYKQYTGREASADFPEWEPCHRALLGNGIVGFENVGGQIDEVTGKRVTFAAFPWRWVNGDGCIVRLVAIVDPSGAYRIESGAAG